MTKNKNNQTIWGTRIQKSTSTIFQKVGNSIDIDKRLYKEDIAGSIAHVEMLFKQKIISFKIKNKIIYGLNKIEKEISKEKFIFNKKYEDIHINIEKRLFQIIGEEAGYLHTARSRNDQVITDLKIWIKSANKNIRNILVNLCNEENYQSIFPPIDLCGDNAAMIAMVGLEKFKLKQFSELDHPAKPRWPLDESAAFLKGAGVKL